MLRLGILLNEIKTFIALGFLNGLKAPRNFLIQHMQVEVYTK